MKAYTKSESRWIKQNRLNSNKRYHKLVNQNHFLMHAESMLKHLGEQYGFGVAIPDQKFLEVNYPFGICTDVISKYTRCDWVVGDYCYSIYQNKTIIINKL